MNPALPALLAITLYVAAAVRTSSELAHNHGHIRLVSLAGALALCALGAHLTALLGTTPAENGFNLGVFNAASWVAWIIAAIAVIYTTQRPVASLSVVILPFAAVVTALSMVFSQQKLVATSPGIAVHIALSLVAYGLFAIAALQAIYLAFAERRLKQHAPILEFLPPLAVMESLMFQLTAIAFVVLSVGLLLGGFYVEDVMGQHLAHKIAFSLMAWVVFALLVYGRYRRHWRGRRAIKFVLGGFVLLALGFFGSKIALELVLNRL